MRPAGLFRSASVIYVDRLVARYGLGYLKFDYNIDAGIGTGLATDSPGDGLLEHNRVSRLAWPGSLTARWTRYPQVA